MFAIAVAPVVVALILVRRGRVARGDAAAILVLWGLLIVVLEHGKWSIEEFGGTDLLNHTGFHFQMLAAYGLSAFALVGIVVTPLIRRGEAIGWYGLLALLAIGLSAELWTAAVTASRGIPPHGVPPTWWIAGVFLWGYPVAWATALALSFRSTFHAERSKALSADR